MSEWKPVRELYSGRHLFWIDEKRYVGPVMGSCVVGERVVIIRPDGFHGDWNVTHFAEITPPKP